MEVFHEAQSRNSAVRLKSHHNKFLLPEEDGDTPVKQHGNGTTASSRWSVEIADGTHVRLKSVKTNMYLTATNDPFRVGLTPKRVTQAFHPTESVEWAPVREGNGRLMLKSRSGTYLCANGSFPPWRSAVTHDLLCATPDVDWAVWAVDVVHRDADVRAAAGDESPAIAVMRRTCSVPANSVADGGNASFTTAGSVTSVRSMSPRRQMTKSATINNQETIIKVNKPLPSKVQMAKKTFLEVQGLDFETVFYSEKLKQLKTSISVLLSHNMLNTNDNYKTLTTNSKLLTMRDQLQALELSKIQDTNTVDEYEEFKERKADMKAKLQMEVMKARELQCRETELNEVLVRARGKRMELMRDLEVVEKKIRVGEEKEMKNEKEMEELCKLIGWRSDIVKGMEGEESLWMKRRLMAKRRIKEINDHWDIIRGSF